MTAGLDDHYSLFIETKEIASKKLINDMPLAPSGKLRHIGNFCSDCYKVVESDPDKRVPRV